MAPPREIVVYVPAGGHPATAGIARGSAIVGLPEPRSDEVGIYFEGAIHGSTGMATLADRAIYAFGRLRDHAPTVAARLVPRDALIAVGTFDPRSGRIMLTGAQSAAAVATWLGVLEVSPVELRPSRPAPNPRGGRFE
jgi:hypothetical protein